MKTICQHNRPSDICGVCNPILGKTLDALPLQVLLGGHGIWTPEIEREIIAWADMRPREIICRKCGLREQLGKPPQSDF